MRSTLIAIMQRRASRASRSDAPVHACLDPPRANPVDRRTRCRSPGTDHAAALCHHACVQPRIHQACEDVAFNVVHARARRGARHMQQNAQQGEHEGQGGVRHWQRPGKDRSCWASRHGGVLAGVRQQLEASPCCTAWSRAVHGKTRRKGRGAAGRTLAGLRSRPKGRVDGAGHGQGGGALSRVALVDERSRLRAAPALLVERAQSRRRRRALAGLWR